MKLKGVVLAGGLGTRLAPLTTVTNKHLLPVYDKPMVFYPIEKLVRAGIDRVMVVTGGPHAGDFLRVLGSGRSFGLRELHYGYQEGEGGIAEALALAEPWAEGDRIAVVLGDNIFASELKDPVRRFMEQESGARIFLKQVSDPERFGVAEIDGDRVVGIEEKPEQPKSTLAVTGIYLYDHEVFSIIPTLKRSGRGELEITDVNRAYIDRGSLRWEELVGWWTDAGTIETLKRATNLVAEGGLR